MTAKRLFGVVKGHREHIADHTGRLYSDNEVADLLNTVHEENEQLKTQLKDCEKRVTDKEVEWIRENTVWEQMPSNKRTYTSTIYHRRNDE